MAGNDSQKQLLSLIRDFASEKSHGEKRIYSLKRRIEELRSELGEASAELEHAKVEKESAEQDLKGYEVQLAMNESSIQALEARNVAVQDEISAFGSDLEALKTEGGANRDEFIKKMLELNASIRKFQESFLSLSNEDFTKAIFSTGISKTTDTNETEVAQRELENELGQVISQTNLVEQECLIEQNSHKLVQQELVDLEAKASLMEKILQGNAELKELANANLENKALKEKLTLVKKTTSKRTEECERDCASLSDDLQRKFHCPSCQQDNSEALGGLQANSRS